MNRGPGRALRSALAALATAVALSGCGAGDAATPAPDATATPPPTIASLLDGRTPDPELTAEFVVRAQGLTGLGEDFRLWRDTAIDYDLHEDVDPLLLSATEAGRHSDSGHVSHLVGREGLSLVHAITAAEHYDSAGTASTAFSTTVDSMTGGCIALNSNEVELPDVGDQATLVTATRTCTFGEPVEFAAIVARYGPLVATTVMQSGSGDDPSDEVGDLADRHASTILAALSDTPTEGSSTTSAFGLCVPEPGETSDARFDQNWESRRTDLIRTFTQDGSTADRDHSAIHQAVLDTLAQANAVLGTNYGGPIDVYFYESIEQLQEAAPYTEDGVLGFAFGQEVHQLCGGTLDGTQWVNMAMSAHEYTHIITLNLWGRTSSQILIEGLAHYATVGERDAFARGYGFELLPPLATIEDDDDWRGRSWGTFLTSYLIEERGGIEPYKELWFAARTADLETAVQAVYGLTLEELDSVIRETYGLR